MRTDGVDRGLEELRGLHTGDLDRILEGQKQSQPRPLVSRQLDITDDQAEYSEMVYQQLRKAGIRIEKDVRNEKLNYKIREAQMEKIPYMLIVGEKEKESRTVTVRLRNGKNLAPMTIEDFAAKIQEESIPGDRG